MRQLIEARDQIIRSAPRRLQWFTKWEDSIIRLGMVAGWHDRAISRWLGRSLASVRERRRKIGLIRTTIALGLVQPALAHGPEEEFADWYQSLRAPDSGMSCCSPSHDCNPIDDYRASATEPGGYEAMYEGAWLPVPASAVLQRADNPTGHAVLCIMHRDGAPVARCFVRAAEG